MNIEQGITKEEGRDAKSRPEFFHFCLRHSLFDIRYSLLLLIGSLAVSPACAAAAQPTQPAVDARQASLANAFARLIENAIPREYEKRKDWGRTKNITTGIRNDGFKLYRRKKPVNHGVWKHYTIRLIEPEKTLAVRIENLRAVDGGRIGFRMTLRARLDLWARIKVYHYGVHLIALETVGDAAVDLAFDCEIGVRLKTSDGGAGVALDPRVVAAQVDITDFNLERISNAKGPIVREIGEELPRLIEHELQGEKLVAKLNRAIEKKRDRLELSFGELLTYGKE